MINSNDYAEVSPEASSEVEWDVAYGLDASLRHGSLVKITRDSSGVYSWDSVFEWGKKGPSIGEKSSLREIVKFALLLSRALMNHEHAPVLIEFDPRSVYWRSGKRQVVTMALFLGCLVGILYALGYPAIFITPEESRRFYRFTKGKKKEFQEHFLILMDHFSIFPKLSKRDLLETDQLDAILIGMMLWTRDWAWLHEGLREEDWIWPKPND